MWLLILGFWLLAALLLFANRPQSDVSTEAQVSCRVCGKPTTSTQGTPEVCEDCRPRSPRRARGDASDRAPEGKVLVFDKHKRRRE